MGVVDRLCTHLAQRLRHRVIERGDDGLPYLIRYYVFRFPWRGGPRVFLHLFLSGDSDPELHNHPWATSVSLILSGGYREERRIRGTNEAEYVDRLPGDINVLRGNDYHRIELLERRAWTMFVAGKRDQSWGYWNRATHEYIAHDEMDRRRTARRAYACAPRFPEGHSER